MKQLSFDSFQETPPINPATIEAPPGPPPMKPKPVLEGTGKPIDLHYQGNQLVGIYVDDICIPTYAMFRDAAFCPSCKSETCDHSKKARRLFKKIPKEWYNNRPEKRE